MPPIQLRMLSRCNQDAATDAPRCDRSGSPNAPATPSPPAARIPRPSTQANHQSSYPNAPAKPHSGCRSTRKRTMRRICRGLLPLKAEIQAILCNPSRPGSQPRDQATRKRTGVRGETLFVSAPAAFRRFRRAKAASQATQKTINKRTPPLPLHQHQTLPPVPQQKNFKSPLAKPEHMCYTKCER